MTVATEEKELYTTQQNFPPAQQGDTESNRADLMFN